MENGVSFSPPVTPNHKSEPNLYSILVTINERLYRIERILDERLINNIGPDSMQRKTCTESSGKSCTCKTTSTKEKK